VGEPVLLGPRRLHEYPGRRHLGRGVLLGGSRRAVWQLRMWWSGVDVGLVEHSSGSWLDSCLRLGLLDEVQFNVDMVFLVSMGQPA
jgi:hypothetical protein